jgi:hypothetical protein
MVSRRFTLAIVFATALYASSLAQTEPAPGVASLGIAAVGMLDGVDALWEAPALMGLRDTERDYVAQTSWGLARTLRFWGEVTPTTYRAVLGPGDFEHVVVGAIEADPGLVKYPAYRWGTSLVDLGPVQQLDPKLLYQGPTTRAGVRSLLWDTPRVRVALGLQLSHWRAEFDGTGSTAAVDVSVAAYFPGSRLMAVFATKNLLVVPSTGETPEDANCWHVTAAYSWIAPDVVSARGVSILQTQLGAAFRIRDIDGSIDEYEKKTEGRYRAFGAALECALFHTVVVRLSLDNRYDDHCARYGWGLRLFNHVIMDVGELLMDREDQVRLAVALVNLYQWRRQDLLWWRTGAEGRS